MSNAFLRATAGTMPTVPTSFVTDDGTAIPAANILNVNGDQTSEDNNNGIRVIANPDLSDNMEIQLTNRFSGTLTTTDATPTSFSSFVLDATPGVYTLDINVAAFDVTDTLGIGYSLFGTVRTDGATATICGTPDKITNEETGSSAADCNLVVSGNSVSIQATGIAGKTIRWNSLTIYILVV